MSTIEICLNCNSPEVIKGMVREEAWCKNCGVRLILFEGRWTPRKDWNFREKRRLEEERLEKKFKIKAA